MDMHEYKLKYKRFVQGIITEEAFNRYLLLTLSKEDCVGLLMAGAKNLKKAVCIGEPLFLEE